MPIFDWCRRGTQNFGEVWVPFAHISLRSSDGSRQSLAIQIDTGAVVSLLRRSVADLLAIELETGRRIELTSVGGSSATAFVHMIHTQFADNIAYEVPYNRTWIALPGRL